MKIFEISECKNSGKHTQYTDIVDFIKIKLDLYYNFA